MGQQNHHGQSADRTPHCKNKFLDDFLLNRIGCQVLLSHFLACRAGQEHGIIDPRCNTKKVCRAAAKAVLEMCIECTGWSPAVFVEAYSACGEGLDDGNTPRFPYMPHVLKYVVMELLKNSCRATADMLSATTDLQVEDVPINVIVCADEDHVTICVSDRARGIPRGVNAWLYLYTTAKNGAYGGEKRLAGHGVGLPLSRLYARYLGGALDLVSLPGYGTHAYVNLPRVQSQQVEVVPDEDYRYDHASLLDFTV
ncbi:[Pyruvate dehydrogenase (acetyl-transferring)] kinase isozyme 4 [Durusdinium trenchii]|uniref:Protein-serine/threonine kinase n=2 Tax=Durusdinium trenchii TaxID=1381693 RepID=A0ABP0KGI7_9DINO